MNMTDLRWISATAVILVTIGNCASNDNVCPVLRQPRNITTSDILGTWYAVRGIEHTELQSTRRLGTKKDCRSMTISQNSESEITLQWNENNVIKLKASNNINFWQSTSNGTSIKTLQVTEVDDKHIVITVCSPSKRLSSAVLHREPSFNQASVTSATNKLAEQNLKTIEIFDRCQSVT